MAVVPPALACSVSFSGKRGDFRALVTRGALLELVTVGFYRFWLTTDIRRHLWSDTAVDDDAFEYTGRGKELLVGFLFALAIIVPVYLAYFLISVEAARFKAFASFPLLVAFRHALWRRASGIDFAARRLDRPLLEGDRLDCSAGTGIRRLSCDMRGSGGEHERSAAQSVLRAAGVLEEYSAAGARRYRLSGVCAGDQRGDQDLSVARSVGEGACLDQRARHGSRGQCIRKGRTGVGAGRGYCRWIGCRRLLGCRAFIAMNSGPEQDRKSTRL